ncbi:MAG: PLD nuclease N-terminal domain-containing protein [Clostridiales bacterium]|nr:PLD nuclease N-terminal domain-containing protein [Clostridiales bacterium]
MEEIMEYLPIILPIFIAEVTLAIVAFVHVQRHPHYKIGNRIVWSFVVLLLQIIGPIAYFIIGRSDEE